MKLQKIILCVAAGLTAFGASLGLLEIGRWIRAACEPLKIELKKPELVAAPVVYPQRIPDFAAPNLTANEESEPEEEEPEDWGKTGEYYVVGKNTKGFEDFEYISIETHVWSTKAEKPVAVKPHGSVLGPKEVKFSWLNLSGNRISFITKKSGGVSYQFDGKFLPAGEAETNVENDFGDEYVIPIVLKGRLTKWRNGVKIAETKVEYAESHGC